MRLRPALIALSLTVAACGRPDSVTPESLTGVWVEKTARKDTLIFNPTFQGQVLRGTLTVNRGKEVNAGGSLAPKTGSGSYNYQLQRNRISVISSSSSSTKRSDYAIVRQNDELQVENFFELGFNQPATATRTLVRL